jgi:ribonucleoside-diphosphate reductase alpha chain
MTTLYNRIQQTALRREQRVKQTRAEAILWNELRNKQLCGFKFRRQHGIGPSIVGSYECIEPQVSNLFKRETLSGDFIQINRYLVQELQNLNLWNENIRTKIKMGEGSIQDVHEIPQKVRDVYRTVWEVPQKSLIEMAALRGPFIDQSQSLNLFIESPTIGKLSSMYLHAWKTGLSINKLSDWL